MIISASRRTDIPAWHGNWFLNRLRAGEVLVRNPYRPTQITRIPLSPRNVDCIVFWSKNPSPHAANALFSGGYGIRLLFPVYLNAIWKRFGTWTPGERAVASNFFAIMRTAWPATGDLAL